MNTAPLSQAQIGIFAECMQNPEKKLYVIAYLYKLGHNVDLERLRQAVLKVVEAHNSTYCRVRINADGNAEQYIDDSEPFEVNIDKIADIANEKPRLMQKMTLDGGKLMYFRLMHDDNGKYLYIQFHHIIFDGASLTTLVSEIGKAYDGTAIEKEEVTAFDCALAEQQMRNGDEWQRDKQWYQDHFTCDDVDTVMLPDIDEDTFKSNTIERMLSVDAKAIDSFCKDNTLKLSNFFTSAFALLLSRYTGDEQVLFSTVWHGRNDKRMARTFGMFVNTMPAFYKITGGMKVSDLLGQGNVVTAETRNHTTYSFSDFCTEQQVLTHQMFVYQGKLFSGLTIGGEPVEVEQVASNTTDEPMEIQLFQTDNGYKIVVSYHAHRFSETFVEQMVQSYENIVVQMMDIGECLDNIGLVAQKQLVLLDQFNHTDLPYDESQTVVTLFQTQAKLHPDKTAVVYNDVRMTYKELDELTDRIASCLAAKGLGAEDVVSVLIPRCEWMATASLAVLKAGCAYQPLDPSYPTERIEFMIQDSGTKLLIADESLRPIAGSYNGDVVFINELAGCRDSGVRPTPPKPDSLMTMIYTSGTTGLPKGCQIEHRNVVAFCHMHQHCHNITDQSRIAAYASYGFDASIEELFGALTIGAELHIIPEEIRLDLVALNEYFERNGITISFMTTQVAYQFATNFECKPLKRLLTGGEKLPALTPPANYVLCNGYGPSESICYVTNFDVSAYRKNIPIGKAQTNVKCYVVDKFGHRLPVGAAGEMWVAGPQVTRGYLNRPEKTAEAYIDNPFDNDMKYNRVYRTGDMVRYLTTGEIEFVGRKDGQVKIRGFRVELKEVEAVIREFKGVKDVTVQAFDEEGGGKFIAAYVVADEAVDFDALNSFIMEQKPPYMAPAAIMQIASIPLNQNQKVNKKALPKPVKRAVVQPTESNAPLNILEEELHSIVAGIVGNGDFGLTTVLGYIGLTSISAIKLAVQLNKRFGVTVNSKSLVKSGTLQSIENEILTSLLNREALHEEPRSGAHAATTNVPLSYAQTGVYVECMKQPASTVYNVPSLIRFPHDTDTTLLAKSVEKVILAHPQFRARFDNAGADVVQTVDLSMPVEIAQSQRSEEELEQYKHEFVKPFRLKQGPLFRMEIVTTEKSVCLLTDVHHLVFDGGSFDIFMKQLCDLMNGIDIEDEAFSFADYVAAEKAAENSEQYMAARDFFNERLAKVEGVTEMQSDLTNPIEQGVTEAVSAPIDFEAIELFCRQHDITPAHLTLAAVFYSLARFTNSEHLCITTISNGRSDLRIRNTVGMFVSTLALSSCINDQKVIDFLNETSANFDATLEHENYPFAQIASDYDISAEIMFAYQMGVVDNYAYNGQKLEIENLELNVPKFRIAIYIKEENGLPSVCVEYDNGRYSSSMMQSLAISVSNAAKCFVNHPEQPLQNVSLLDNRQTALLDSFNHTDVAYDDSQNIVSLFRRQVEQNPDNQAVVYHEKAYTYREVDEISERIASHLVEKGLGAEDVVSVLIPRCEWMVIASLGVLKAGCAYQPLDPSYPSERLNFMMSDANAKMLIADESLRDVVNEYQGDVLLTNDIASLPAAQPVKAEIKPSNLFILLYTSGSTGIPKGCQLEHRNIVAFCHWYQRHYGLTSADRVAAYASYGFDACMMDLYPALTCGACVHIIGDDIRLNLPDLNTYFNQQGITHSFITTQVGYQFATNVDNHSLRCFAVGGEKLSALNPPRNYKMYNGYGPTECTIFTTNYWVRDYELDIPIGKPLDNMRLYIVDKHFNRLPTGAAGELWVSGPQVSRGYLNRPEKNAETFLPNPFCNDLPHNRIYRTGDIVRFLHDGNVQFVGRKDGQVKIRGFRIEMKEVEAVIRQYPGIKDVTVQAFDYENGGKFIAAYVVSDQTVDVKKLNAFIGERKPSYMIPAAIMQIDSIPLNQNQKVNRKMLPSPVIQPNDREYVAPSNEFEKMFCHIFADVLAMDKIGATDNFFDLGGTSLMVTRIIIEADKAGVHVAYGDVFSNPTPRKLAALVTGSTEVGKEENDAANYDYSEINKLLETNTLDEFRNGGSQKLGNVLLTGATGYLGIHVFKELISTDTPNVYCLVRDKDVDSAEHRLKTLLFYYFEDTFDDLFGSRIHVILGDVTGNLTEMVKAPIDTVFNCAAVVKHFSKGTEIEDVNIGGAQQCVSFCLANKARLVHVSTASTRGLRVNGTPAADLSFTEQHLYDGQYLGNQYVYSKFIAERIVLQAVAAQGLSAKVVRVGNLSARSTDGEFQVNFSTNAFMGRIKVYDMLGCIPYGLYEQQVEFSPINEVAQAIILLASTPEKCCLYHAYNSHSQFLGDVLNRLKSVDNEIRFVEQDVYDSALEAATADPAKSKTLSSLVAYQDLAHGMKVSDIVIDNHYTTQVLHRLGFTWSATTWDYVDKMLDAISGLGFFD